ncbi:MAG TPA: hypothetical protein VHX63_10800 [Acidobacteriaceae bacterium]|jgi:predicted DNA-binding protein (UPF0251 family)|nr:hypothetical protein [Acidobacteriaceae bacterium]
MSSALRLFELQAEGNGTLQPDNTARVRPKDIREKKQTEERRPAQRQGLAFYRKYTEAMLRRYMRLSMRVGRMPSFLGQDVFRGKTSTYRINSFEDAIIFVHDMEKCIERLDAFSQQILTRVAIQEYTQGEAAHLLRVSLRTIVRRYGDALDDLTEILLDRKLMRIEPNYSESNQDSN